MSSTISPNSFAQGPDGKLYWVTTLDSLKINDKPSIVVDKQKLSSILPKKVAISTGEAEGASVTIPVGLLDSNPNPIRAETCILNIGSLQPSSNDSTSNNLQENDPKATGQVNTSNSPQQEDKQAKTSPKFKTVKIKRNGVIQTLLVPSFQGQGSANTPGIQQTDSSSHMLPNNQTSPTKESTTTVFLSPKTSGSGTFIPLAPSATKTSPTVVTIPNNWNKNNSVLICTDGTVTNKQSPVKQCVNTADKNALIVVGEPAQLNTGSRINTMPVLRNALVMPDQGPQPINARSILPNPLLRTDTHAESETLKIQSVFSLNKQHQSLLLKTDDQIDSFANCSEVINIEPKPEFDTSTELDLSKEKIKMRKTETQKAPKTERLKRKASTQGGFGCKNCPGCCNQSRKRKRKQDLYYDKNIMSLKQSYGIKEITVSLKRIKMGRKHSLSMEKFEELNPTVVKKKNFARKSTSKASIKFKPKSHSNIHPPLNFSKYYLVRSPTGTFLVPRSSEVPPGEPSPVVFRVVNYNTGRAVAIKTKKGVEKMFVKAMDADEVPDGLTNQVEAMTKSTIPSGKSPKPQNQVKMKTEPFTEGHCDRTNKVKNETFVVNGEHSDTESASEGARESENSEVNESKEEELEHEEPPVLEPQLSATERLEMLKQKLKSQMAKLDQIRSQTESAKQLLESLDNDED